MASPYQAGELPDHTDVIVGSVFIVIFALAGIGLHLRTSHTYGHRFVWTLALLLFCVARILAIGFRIALKSDLHNKALACISQILLAAGVAILFVVNIQMSRRFWCQLHPHHAKWVAYGLTGAAYLVDPLVIVDRDIRIVCSIFFVALAFLPIPVVLLVLALRQFGITTTKTNRMTSTDGAALEGGEKKKRIMIPSVESSRAPSSENLPLPGLIADRPWLKVILGRSSKNPLGPHFPDTGIGATPMSSRGILENAAVILIPSILLTIEQGIRVAQIHYLPHPPVSLPW
ncbi:hypothetical protein FRC17_001826, partial [Serendipita sp. 399]